MEETFVANLAPVGSLQETVNIMNVLAAKDAEIAALKARLAGTVYDIFTDSAPPQSTPFLYRTNDHKWGIGFWDSIDGPPLRLVAGNTWWLMPGGE